MRKYNKKSKKTIKRKNRKNRTNKRNKRGGFLGMNKYLPESMRMKGIGINRILSGDSKEMYDNKKIISKTQIYDDMRNNFGNRIQQEIIRDNEKLQNLQQSGKLQMLPKIKDNIQFYENLVMQLTNLDNDRNTLDFNKGEYQFISNKITEFINRLNNIIDLYYQRSGYIKPNSVSQNNVNGMSSQDLFLFTSM